MLQPSVSPADSRQCLSAMRLAVIGLALLVPAARADTIVRYATDVPPVSGSNWTDESESEGNPGCASCPCNSTQIPYSFNPGPNQAADKTFLEAVDFGPITIPAGHVVTRVNVDVMCRFNDGTTGRIRVIPEALGADLAIIDSNSFTSDEECKYRLGDLGDITVTLPVWDQAALDSLKVRVRRAGNNDTILRVRAFRLTVETAFIPIGNDECPGFMIQGQSTWFDLAGATPSGPASPSDCFDSKLADVWFYYLAGETGTVTFATCGGPADTIIGIYDGACGTSFNECDDDSSCDVEEYAASLSFDVVAGGAYVIRIGSYDGPISGFLDTTFVAAPPTPANDECAGALLVGNGELPFDTASATTSAGGDLGECGEIVQDIWYQYESPCDGEALFFTCGVDLADTILAVYGGSCSNLELLACNDDTSFCPGGPSAVILPVAVGQVYWIRLGGYFGEVAGTLLVNCVTSPPPWSDLGSGLAGTAGIPSLSGSGNLTPGGAIALDLSSAKPLAPSVLFVSDISIPKPFKGGVILANPPLVSLPLFTDALGAVGLNLPVPASVESGTTYYFQFMIRDLAAVQGVALSNAVGTLVP